jgi:hypothetical protein
MPSSPLVSVPDEVNALSDTGAEEDESPYQARPATMITTTTTRSLLRMSEDIIGVIEHLLKPIGTERDVKGIDDIVGSGCWISKRLCTTSGNLKLHEVDDTQTRLKAGDVLNELTVGAMHSERNIKRIVVG